MHSSALGSPLFGYWTLKLLLIVDVVDVMKIVEPQETGKYRCAKNSPLEKVL